jgi:hypothetical protein
VSQVVIVLAGGPSRTQVTATREGDHWHAVLRVPPDMPAGFWPLVARYGTTAPTNSVSTQIKVFRP